MENTVDPDLIALSADLDLQCFQNVVNPGSAGQGLFFNHLQALPILVLKRTVSVRWFFCVPKTNV